MTSFNVKQLSSVKAFSCLINRYSHTSPTLGGLSAVFSVILPPQPSPALYFLSGLTCTDENFITKAGAAQHALQYGVAIVAPDTSPRGAGIDGEDADWDFGTGAGFYVDAIVKPWSKFYNMYSYVMHELPAVVADACGEHVLPHRSITGHSMGGYGALMMALRHPEQFASVSAFAPIANPSNCPWGEKCFGGYLGEDQEKWKDYDPTEIVSGSTFSDILVDQGLDDGFGEKQLKVHNFVDKCVKVGQKVTLGMHEGYDHSYYFIQTFLGKHVEFHARALHDSSTTT